MIAATAIVFFQSATWPSEFALPSESTLTARRQTFGDTAFLELDSGLHISFTKWVPYSYEKMSEAARFAPDSTYFRAFGFIGESYEGTWPHFVMSFERDHWFVMRTFRAGKRGPEPFNEISLSVYRYSDGQPLNYYNDAMAASNSDLWQPTGEEWLMDTASIRPGGRPIDGLAILGPFVVRTTVRVGNFEAATDLTKSLMLWVRFRALVHGYHTKPGDGRYSATLGTFQQINVVRFSSRDYVSGTELRRVGILAETVPGAHGPVLRVTLNGRTKEFKALDWNYFEGTQSQRAELPSMPYAGELYVSLQAILD